MLPYVLFSALLMVTPTIFAQEISEISDTTDGFSTCITLIGDILVPTGEVGIPTSFYYETIASTVFIISTAQETTTIPSSQHSTFRTLTRSATSPVRFTTTPQSPPITEGTSQQPTAAIPQYTSSTSTPLVEYLMARWLVKLRLEGAKQDRKSQSSPKIAGQWIDNPDDSASSLNDKHPHDVICYTGAFPTDIGDTVVDLEPTAAFTISAVQ